MKPQDITGVIRKLAGTENLEIDILIVYTKDLKLRMKQRHLQLKLI